MLYRGFSFCQEIYLIYSVLWLEANAQDEYAQDENGRNYTQGGGDPQAYLTVGNKVPNGEDLWTTQTLYLTHVMVWVVKSRNLWRPALLFGVRTTLYCYQAYQMVGNKASGTAWMPPNLESCSVLWVGWLGTKSCINPIWEPRLSEILGLTQRLFWTSTRPTRQLAIRSPLGTTWFPTNPETCLEMRVGWPNCLRLIARPAWLVDEPKELFDLLNCNVCRYL